MKKKRERDPNRIWLDNGEWYLEIDKYGYCVVHDEEQLACYRGPEILLQTSILDLGEKTDEGVLVKAPTVPWFEILKQVTNAPDFLFRFAKAPRKFEQFVAGAYHQAQWDGVTLTPSSGDKGIDVIATIGPKNGRCSSRVLEQVKAYSLGRLVRANDVRAMIHVLDRDLAATNGMVTTTSDFAPKVGDEFSEYMPRLELKNGKQLLKWLAGIQSASAA